MLIIKHGKMFSLKSYLASPFVLFPPVTYIFPILFAAREGASNLG